MYKLSSRGLWTIPFHPKIYESKFRIDTILSSLEYSFEYKNPFGVDLYVDLEKDNKKILPKTLVKEKNKFGRIFKDLDTNVDYTFVVYQQQYSSKVYYYTIFLI